MISLCTFADPSTVVYDRIFLYPVPGEVPPTGSRGIKLPGSGTDVDTYQGRICTPADEGRYFDVPGNCGSYYRCIRGLKVQFFCRDNTNWNKQGQHCDHPENVRCDLFGKNHYIDRLFSRFCQNSRRKKHSKFSQNSKKS